MELAPVPELSWSHVFRFVEPEPGNVKKIGTLFSNVLYLKLLANNLQLCHETLNVGLLAIGGEVVQTSIQWSCQNGQFFFGNPHRL